MGRPVELVFEFDRLRNFSAMYLHTSNLLSQKVQVFSHAKVYLSVGGKVFNGEPVQYSYMPDLVMEQARNVTVKLHHRVGRFIKLQLYFANAWLLISEVSFDSGANIIIMLHTNWNYTSIYRAAIVGDSAVDSYRIKRKGTVVLFPTLQASSGSTNSETLSFHYKTNS
ncbi:hypothetical protein AAG570_004600 [Ranatra chinensis]|uniref:Discoidin domain-containing protein n=1 Tax=Ranatra chinensis TaxID=642074 RepID=A0ABD0YJI1_9HEMI